MEEILNSGRREEGAACGFEGFGVEVCWDGGEDVVGEVDEVCDA